MRFFVVFLLAVLFVSCSPEKIFEGNEAIVYVKNQNTERDLFQSDTLGKWERRLTTSDGASWFPQWNIGLDKLMFYAVDPQEKFLMKSLDLKTKEIKYFPNLGLATPSLSPNGDKVFYTRLKSGSRHIWWCDVDGKSKRQLTVGAGLNGPFAISVDSRKMAYISNNTGSNELYVMDLESLKIKQLTDNDMIEKDISWSPSGDQIAFTMRLNEANSKTDIYIIDVDGSGQYALTKTPYAEDKIAWSLSGRKMAFHASTENDGDQIYTIDLADGKFTKITSGNDYHTEPTWIPEVK